MSGLGDEWLTAPAPMIDGLYFPGYSAADANPDLGDSAIAETVGLGGFSMAAARPSSSSWAARRRMRWPIAARCCKSRWGPAPRLFALALSFTGAPSGIDARLVVDTGVAPIINTGIAHRQAGIGQVGAGLVRAPMACFERAIARLAETLAE